MRMKIAETNAALVQQGKLKRFSHVRPGTGRRGRPGRDQINELPAGDVLFVDELTGLAVQGRANLSRSEAVEVAIIDVERPVFVEAFKPLRAVA